MAVSARVLPVSYGLLDHRRNMGSSIWEYLWLLAHVTAGEPGENETCLGIVDRGNPIPTSRIAGDLKRSREATLVNLEKLEAGNYISRSAAAGRAYTYRIYILPAELSD